MTVQRAEIEDKLREIQEVVDDTTEGAKSVGVAVAVGIVLLLLIVYLLGRRKGRKGSAEVQIFRLS